MTQALLIRKCVSGLCRAERRRLLSIDGGGIRCMIAVGVLPYVLMHRITREPDLLAEPLATVFQEQK